MSSEASYGCILHSYTRERVIGHQGALQHCALWKLRPPGQKAAPHRERGGANVPVLGLLSTSEPCDHRLCSVREVY